MRWTMRFPPRPGREHYQRVGLLLAIALLVGDWRGGCAQQAAPPAQLHRPQNLLADLLNGRVELDRVDADPEVGPSEPLHRGGLLWEYSRRQEGGGGEKRKCLTATVEVPIIGQCKEVFQRPVPLRVCVRNASEAMDRVRLPVVGPRDRLAIADLSPYADLAQSYVNSQCRLRWQDWISPPTFVYTCYGGLKEMEICGGLDDYFTCTLGTCIRLMDRPDWPIDWWERIDPAAFGGDTPLLYDTRQWYCSDSPGYPLGLIQIGNLGSQMYYARSSNPWIKHECDLTDDLGNPLKDPDAQCQSFEGEPISEDNPVLSECCGFCVLNNAHLMKNWNCTGLASLVGNTLGINALARYCTVTKGCKETRPCLGDPVKMGDPQVLLDPTTYSVRCDQLDKGCDEAGRCQFRWACDNRLESLRERVGYYRNDQPEPESSTGWKVHAIPALSTSFLGATVVLVLHFHK